MKPEAAFGRKKNMNKECGFDFVDLTCNLINFLQK